MKRKTSAVPTLVYSYGVPSLSPEHAKIVGDQIFLASRYRNRLVEIERARRAAFRSIVGGLSPKLGTLQTEHEAMHAKYLEQRRALCNVSKSDRDSSPLAAKVRELAEKRDAIYRDLHAERRAVLTAHVTPAREEMARLKKEQTEELKKKQGKVGPHTLRKITAAVRKEMRADSRWSDAWKAIDTANGAAEDQWKLARSKAGLFHATYAAVDDAAMRSFADSQFDPRFTTFDHTGKVGAQIRGASMVADVLAENRPNAQLAINVTHALTRGRQLATMHLLLGLDRETGERVYIDVPFLMHRTLPDQATIKWVYLKVDRVGLRTTYELQFTIEVARERVVPKTGLVAINLGWRRMPDGGIRIATVHDGKVESDVRLPAGLWDDIQRAERILGHADDHFNAARTVARDWLRSLPASDRKAVEGAMGHVKLAAIAQWRAHSKLAKLTRVALSQFFGAETPVSDLWHRWRQERIPKPERTPWSRWHGARLDLFASVEELSAWFLSKGCSRAQIVPLYLEWWRRKDAHLIDMARGTQRRVRFTRRDVYRVTARRLADHYQSVAVEAWDMSRTAKLPLPERDSRVPQEERASGLRQFVGVSILAQAIKLAFGGARVMAVPPQDISRIHAGCGGALSNSLRSSEVHCGECGRMVDQDVNAARAMWLRAKAGEPSGGEHSGDKEKRGTPREGIKIRSRGKIDISKRPGNSTQTDHV